MKEEGCRGARVAAPRAQRPRGTLAPLVLLIAGALAPGACGARTALLGGADAGGDRDVGSDVDAEPGSDSGSDADAEPGSDSGCAGTDGCGCDTDEDCWPEQPICLGADCARGVRGNCVPALVAGSGECWSDADCPFDGDCCDACLCGCDDPACGCVCDCETRPGHCD